MGHLASYSRGDKVILLFPLFATFAWIHVLITDQPDPPPKPKAKPVYKMQSAKSRPYFAPRKRDAEFYRERRTKKVIRKLPF